MRAFDRYFKNEIKFDEIKPLLINYTHLPYRSRKLLFTSNHDENTYNGTEYEKYGSSAKHLQFFLHLARYPLIYSGAGKTQSQTA
jgi:hypothetical protein